MNRIKLVNCTTAIISGNCKDLIGGAGNGSLFVNIINNGSPVSIPVIVAQGTNGNFSIPITITSSTNVILVNVVSGCSAGSGDANTFINIPTGNFCDLVNERRTEFTRTFIGDESIEYRLSRYSNWHSNRIDAEVRSHRLINGSWKNQKRKMRATADEVRRNINCISVSNHSNTNRCNNCNFLRARITFGHLSPPPAHCDGDVVGVFWKDVFGVEVNGTASLDFECCIR